MPAQGGWVPGTHNFVRQGSSPSLIYTYPVVTCVSMHCATCGPCTKTMAKLMVYAGHTILAHCFPEKDLKKCIAYQIQYIILYYYCDTVPKK